MLNTAVFLGAINWLRPLALSACIREKARGSGNGAPFQAWDLPVSIQGGSGSHSETAQGDRGFVDLLLMAGRYRPGTLEVACDLTLHGVMSAAIVLNEMRRLPSQPTDP